METKQKLDEKELETLKILQQNFQNVQFELGDIEIVKLQIQSRYGKVLEFFENLKKEEETFISSIKEKYGNISLNPENGEFEVIE
jgi:hypothetical protein